MSEQHAIAPAAPAADQYAVSFKEKIYPLGDWPVVSVVRLAQRGLNHVMQNEVASKVVGEIRKAVSPDKPSEVSTDAIKAYRKAHETDIDVLEAKYQAEAFVAIAAGKLGDAGNRGPRLDPLQTEIRKIATTLVRAQLKANNLKEPKGDERLPFGSASFTMRELVERRLSRDLDSITRDAKAIVRENERRIANATKAAEASKAADGETMGF